MAYWTRIESDPPPHVSDAYGNAAVWWGLLFCAAGASLGAWIAWG